jgi:hypothetical protein
MQNAKCYVYRLPNLLKIFYSLTRKYENDVLFSRMHVKFCTSSWVMNIHRTCLTKWWWEEYSQFCYYNCFVSTNRLQRYLWTGERCLYNANFRICVLAIARSQRPVWRQKVGRRAKYFFPSHPNFITLFSTTRGLSKSQLPRYSCTDCTLTQEKGN